ncbi:Crp/Fnr family transcriptional regulator [Frankia sp. Cr2]|uniref:Crp/Fnr family transcriptional regulator n=1 Tax=Frankia sp. Cr2 TaxID=3073932 RepID=UPI002AD3E1CE|nr:Crp/Fnr family transcriptional regulator [Frankia sp. Cr2]
MSAGDSGNGERGNGERGNGESGSGESGRMSPADRSAFEVLGMIRTYRNGDVLLQEGDRADRTMMIRSGRVKIVTVAESGYETLLAHRGPGDLIGEMAVIDGETRSASVVALEDVTVAVVSAEVFRAFIADHPEVARAMVGSIAQRLRESDRRRSELGAYPTAIRLARHLLELAQRHGQTQPDGGVMITLRPTHHDLAAAIGASRESVGRELSVFRSQGMISNRGRTIVVSKVEELRAFAYGETTHR